jgi:hypothetical protein
VCKDGKCTNICTKEQQLKKIKSKHKKLRAKAAKTARFEVTDSTDVEKFAMKPGESRNARLARLEKEGIYVSGAVMSIDYGNLVNFGTMDRMKVAEIKRARRAKQSQINVQRYGTRDIKKIVEIEKTRKGGKEEMWKRMYGTKDPDKIHRLPASVRKRKCDADPECVRRRKMAQLFKRR